MMDGIIPYPPIALMTIAAGCAGSSKTDSHAKGRTID